MVVFTKTIDNPNFTEMKLLNMNDYWPKIKFIGRSDVLLRILLNIVAPSRNFDMRSQSYRVQCVRNCGGLLKHYSRGCHADCLLVHTKLTISVASDRCPLIYNWQTVSARCQRDWLHGQTMTNHVSSTTFTTPTRSLAVAYLLIHCDVSLITQTKRLLLQKLQRLEFVVSI